jgi:hypothetical protein
MTVCGIELISSLVRREDLSAIIVGEIGVSWADKRFEACLCDTGRRRQFM